MIVNLVISPNLITYIFFLSTMVSLRESGGPVVQHSAFCPPLTAECDCFYGKSEAEVTGFVPWIQTVPLTPGLSTCVMVVVVHATPQDNDH